MRKNSTFFFVLLLSFYGTAQSIHLKNEYGEKIYFVDGKTLKASDRYGKAILFSAKTPLDSRTDMEELCTSWMNKL